MQLNACATLSVVSTDASLDLDHRSKRRSTGEKRINPPGSRNIGYGFVDMPMLRRVFSGFS